MQINNNNYSVLEILEMLHRQELVVNKEYQRGSDLWPDTASAYFIDTIISGFTFPKIYIYEYLDRPNRRVKREIVDGQQRIGAIKRFYNNEFILRAEGPDKGKDFAHLDEEKQDQFLSYVVPVDVIRNANRSDILQMFRRMNAYTLPLNDAEKRHSSYHGQFKWFINSISDSLGEFFVEFGVFTTRQVTRMADSTLIADCVLSLERGVISTSAKDLQDLYKKYDDNFGEMDNYREKVAGAFDFIAGSLGELRHSYMMKPYALHSLVTALMHCRHGIPAIEQEWAVAPIGRFATDVALASRNLVAMAQAHETKDVNGRYSRYVWGCLSTVDRKARRTARVAAIMRVLGAEVPEAVDANIA